MKLTKLYWLLILPLVIALARLRRAEPRIHLPLKERMALENLQERNPPEEVRSLAWSTSRAQRQIWNQYSWTPNRSARSSIRTAPLPRPSS